VASRVATKSCKYLKLHGNSGIHLVASRVATKNPNDLGYLQDLVPKIGTMWHEKTTVHLTSNSRIPQQLRALTKLDRHVQ
jgi:hypothetical protein